jgi:hypothetical protein
MHTKWYRHTLSGRAKVWYLRVSGVLAAIIFSGMGLFFVIGPILVYGQLWVGGICLGLWAIIFSWTLCFLFFNLYPDVSTDLEGISISYMLRRRKILWDDVMRIETRGALYHRTVVTARKITPFHRLYGWLYGRWFQPSFLISDWLEDRDELVEEIERNIRLRR